MSNNSTELTNNFNYNLLDKTKNMSKVIYQSPVTIRLGRKGMIWSDVLKLKDLNYIEYGNRGTRVITMIPYSVLGTAIQTAFSILYGDFKVSNLFFFKSEILEKLHFAYKNEYELVSFCIWYANRLNNRRIGIISDDIPLNLIDNEIINYVIRCANNINKYISNYKLVYEEEDIFLKHKYLNSDKYSLCFGDYDILTTNSIIDIKCVRDFKRVAVTGIIQQLMYYYMIKYGNSKFNYKPIKYLRLYNPIYDSEYMLKIDDFNYECLFLRKVFKECY